MKKLSIKDLLIINAGMTELTKVDGPFNPQTGQYEQKPRALGVGMGLACARAMAAIDPILTDYSEQRAKLVEMYTDGSKVDERGNRPFRNDKSREKFAKEEKELHERTVPVALPDFTTKDFEHPWVTADMLFKLRRIITDFNAPAETADGPKKDEQAA